MIPGRATLNRLQAQWEAHWPDALAHWSRFTQLQPPVWCLTQHQEEGEGLGDGFAMIRLVDHRVVISLRRVVEQGLEVFPLEIMAHEIGHHVYAPADLNDHGRLLARMRAGLGTKTHLAPLVANLYTDLLINDRLQRQRGLDLAGVYQRFAENPGDRLWRFYMRIYELLWSLQSGTLSKGEREAELDTDAQLGARLIRAYARDWLDGAGRFAVLCLPYLLQDEGAQTRQILRGWLDTGAAGQGGEPTGLVEVDPEEQEGAIHPAEDPELTGLLPQDGEGEDGASEPQGRERIGGRKKIDQYRGPSEYGELLKALGTGVDRVEATIRYYRERARPHLIPFPVREVPISADPLPEGLAGWQTGEPLERIDWLQTVLRSPWVIPGYTTVQRTWGVSPGSTPEREPLDLYIGVDCSGSMPNPASQLSWPVLAGTILAMSALRAGARVMVVLSGEPHGETLATDGFLDDEREVLKVLTGYLGTGYGFGIHHLHDTFLGRRPSARPVHILLVTDQDIFEMLKHTRQRERQRWNGWRVAEWALGQAKGGGSVLLNMPPGWLEEQQQRLGKIGWQVHRVNQWEDLIAFARAFSRANYLASGRTNS